MNLPGEIHIDDYDYILPDNRVAKFPLNQRDHSKLLIFKGLDKTIQQDNFYNLPDYIPAGSLMVFNNTRVIFARLKYKKSSGAEIEIFCLSPVDPTDYSLIFQKTGNCTWLCMVGNLKRWKNEEINTSFSINGIAVNLSAKRVKPIGNSWEIEFSWNDQTITFGEILKNAGDVPIPPYLRRQSVESDKTNYQTIYSKVEGSVAAPTAGLHFTPRVFEGLEKKSVQPIEITLHVGAGTFQPVKSDTVNRHEMHSETFYVRKAALCKILAERDKIIAVGTTSVRTIESIYWLGVKLLNNEKNIFNIDQWECYHLPQNIEVKESISAILDYMEHNKLESISASTRMMIVPGYKFRLTGGIITNYHQPKSTLLLLIAAYAGNSWKDIYRYALENDFRFLSYGDSSLLLPG